MYSAYSKLYFVEGTIYTESQDLVHQIGETTSFICSAKLSVGGKTFLRKKLDRFISPICCYL